MANGQALQRWWSGHNHRHGRRRAKILRQICADLHRRQHALVIFGFRQSVAGLTTLPGNATLLALQSLQPVSAEQIDRLIAEEKQALMLQETAERWSNLSTALAVRPTKEEDRL